MISKAKRKADNKFHAKTYTVLGCKVRKEVADEFRAECKKNNDTPNEIFKMAMADYMREKTGKEIRFTKMETPKY